MLNWMRIKNLALVEEADIEFSPGFNVISGETGAGKSVIIGGVGLLLGERAEKSSIRTGSERCEVSGEFSLDSAAGAEVRKLLAHAGIEEGPEAGSELNIRRVITPSSTRNFVNDSPVALQTLKEIGDLLVDIHGANEHQTLLRNAAQLELLDRYARIDEPLGNCAKLWSSLRELRARRDDFLSKMPSENEARLLRDEIAEIEKAAPGVNEDSEINERHALAANSRQILELTSRAAAILSEAESSVVDRLSEALRVLRDLERFAPGKGGELLKAGEEISGSLKELSRDISVHGASVDLDEREFAALEERLRVLQTLKRRYGPALEDVARRLEESKERLLQFENSAQIREGLEKEERELIAKHKAACAALSKRRAEAAAALAKEVVRELERLDFLKSSFSVSLLPAEPGPKGSDKVEFMFTANPGQPERPLREVASSGEMSRVMLAIKCVLAEADRTPMLIFDEIDVNIGGKTAAKVGSGLAKLASSHQVLCISHLPQVASKAQAHFLVEKSLSKDSAVTEIRPIEGERRVKEIARMLGGGKAATAHARELLEG